MEKVKLSELFWSFAKVGICTFGGGYAMLPILEKEVVDKKKWITSGEMLDYYAVGQCTPGIIAINTATFIGYKKRGVIGGIIATLGIIFPSFLIILAIATLINNFAENPYVQSALRGINVAVCAVILNAVVGLWKKGVKDKLGVAIFIITLVTSLFFSVSPVWIVVGSISLGIIYGRIKERKGGKQQ